VTEAECPSTERKYFYREKILGASLVPDVGNNCDVVRGNDDMVSRGSVHSLKGRGDCPNLYSTLMYREISTVQEPWNVRFPMCAPNNPYLPV
jgi:hypothetical protein